MADVERKQQPQETASEKERFADQQFGATAARDQEQAFGDPSTDTDADGGLGESETRTPPRAGNKAEPA